MIENTEKPAEYFSRNAETWIADAYSQSGFNYPTPYHRLRIVKQILSKLPDVKRLLDVGCGGGHLAAAIAADGMEVHGVDQSDEMLANAKKLLSSEAQDVQARVSLEKSSIADLGSSNFDALTSMGVIGYLPSDDDLFHAAAKSLRSQGYCILSFRNRLFNLFSLSHRTLAEVQSGEFERLYAETRELQQQVSEADTRGFLQAMRSVSEAILSDKNAAETSDASPSQQQGQSYTSDFEARQTTPKEAQQAAQRCGFDLVSLHGVHPHLAVPTLNQMLPPQVYNRLCDSLIPLEQNPMALLWSSVFIGVFRKRD